MKVVGRGPLVIGKFNPGVGEWRGLGEVEEWPFQGRVVCLGGFTRR
ncbi:MAG: hypothetical protein JWO91_3211 [Acidobacteriaceae bacterium]|jgi:hypothetical protein|nr:hypothetical protein [Acidobacteriaceae bacterium]